MTDELFRRGGPHNIRKTGRDQYTMQIKLPTDAVGMTARECTDAACSPGSFKIKYGTGLTEEQAESFCPYCRAAADPEDFATREQLRYAKDIAMSEAQDGVERMLKSALGFQQFDDAVRDRLVDVQSHRRLRRSVGDQMGWALCQCVHVLPLSSYD